MLDRHTGFFVSGRLRAIPSLRAFAQRLAMPSLARFRHCVSTLAVRGFLGGITAQETLSPLIRYGLGYALECPGPLNLPLWTWWHLPYALLTAFNNVCRNEWRQILQPEPRLLSLAVSELPRMDDLRLGRYQG